VLRYRELRDRPTATVDRVCEFLGVPTGLVDEVPRHNVRPDVSGRSSGPSPAERAAALPRFAADVPKVAALTGWDVGEWAW
jgi:hypothetical protein